MGAPTVCALSGAVEYWRVPVPPGPPPRCSSTSRRAACDAAKAAVDVVHAARALAVRLAARFFVLHQPSAAALSLFDSLLLLLTSLLYVCVFVRKRVLSRRSAPPLRRAAARHGADAPDEPGANAADYVVQAAAGGVLADADEASPARSPRRRARSLRGRTAAAAARTVRRAQLPLGGHDGRGALGRRLRRRGRGRRRRRRGRRRARRARARARTPPPPPSATFREAARRCRAASGRAPLRERRPPIAGRRAARRRRGDVRRDLLARGRRHRGRERPRGLARAAERDGAAGDGGAASRPRRRRRKRRRRRRPERRGGRARRAPAERVGRAAQRVGRARARARRAVPRPSGSAPTPSATTRRSSTCSACSSSRCSSSSSGSSR